MSRVRTSLTVSIALALVAVTAAQLNAQAPELQPVVVGSAMADFTLPTLQGGEVTISDLRGKRVMLVFPRGHSQPDAWCHICPYQHAELAEYDELNDFRESSNLEILFVLPYSMEKVSEWADAFPALLQDIEDWKNPADPSTLDAAAQARLERVRGLFPRAFEVTPDDVRNSFPVLVDADHAVSEGLGLFTTDWGGSTAEQNVPTIYIVDENGILRFKYMSQNTVDRPSLDYLVRFLEVMDRLGS